MAHASVPSIHGIEPGDIEIKAMPEEGILIVTLTGEGGVNTAGHLFVAGDSDRERLNNLLAIAQRIRCAALDLTADLANNPGQRSYTCTGEPPRLPDAARAVPDRFAELHDAALPSDAPGAWIRNAIEAASEPTAVTA